MKCPKIQKQRISNGKYIVQRLWGETLVCRDKCVLTTVYLGMDDKEDDFKRRLREESCYDGNGHRLICNSKRRVMSEARKDELGLETY